jgi:hypothetical protein
LLHRNITIVRCKINRGWPSPTSSGADARPAQMIYTKY